MTVEQAYREHHRSLFKTLRRTFLRARPASIEDALSRTWLVAVRLGDDRLDDECFSYLLTIARRELYAIFKEHDQVSTPLVVPAGISGEPWEIDPFDAIPDDGLTPHEHVEHRECLARLRALSSGQQTALLGRAIGLSYKELAAATGRTVTWVNRHTTEGRAALREAA